MPYATIDGLRLHYQSIGDGPPVLFIHGWASSWRMWARSMSRVARAGYCAWAVDLIGFGLSDQPGNSWYTLDRFLAVLTGFLARLGIERPAIVGHSMGGAIALGLAAERTARSVLVACPVVNGELSLSLRLLIRSPLARTLFDWMRRMDVFSALGEMKLMATPALARDPGRRRNAEDLRATTVNAAVGSLRMVFDSNLEERLADIRVPTLVLVGQRDSVVAPAQGRLAAERVPGARLVVWPQAGHLLIDDRADDFDSLLLEHLVETRAGRAGATDVAPGEWASSPSLT